MANLKKRNNFVSVENSRWAAYATAGAATALAGVQSAEAVIHHFDVNQVFNAPPGNAQNGTYYPGGGSVYFIAHQLLHGPASSSVSGLGHASFAIGASGTGTAAFVGYNTGGGGLYVTKLGANANVSLGNFVTNGGFFAVMARHGVYGQFLDAGEGFVGIQFNMGGGTQYGWVRFNMDGGNHGSFTLVDYAYGDPGEAIQTGQTASVPEPGSLALLAIGAAGLVAWRRARAQKAA